MLKIKSAQIDSQPYEHIPGRDPFEALSEWSRNDNDNNNNNSRIIGQVYVVSEVNPGGDTIWAIFSTLESAERFVQEEEAEQRDNIWAPELEITDYDLHK